MYCCLRSYFLTVFVILVILALGGCQAGARYRQPPEAKNGILDLTRWDFAGSGPVKLDGEWEFYWEQLLEPKDFARESNEAGYKRIINIPRSWNGYIIDGQPVNGEGYATFRLKILLPDDGHTKSINLPTISTAHKLWINGRPVSSLGKVAVAKEYSIPKSYSRVIPLVLDGDTAELVLQVSNFSHRRGGIWQPITFGNSDQIYWIYEKQLVLNMVLLGSLLIMAFYHLAIYLLHRQNTALLCFGLFCLLMALRVSLVGQIILLKFLPRMPQELVLKLEYFTFYLGIPLFFLYIYYLFPRDVSKKAVLLFWVISIGYLLHVLLTPALVYSRFLYSYDVIATAFLLYILYSMFLALIRKRKGAALVIAGAGVLAGTAINDVLYYAEKSPIGNMWSLGAFVFIFLQSYIFSSRFARAFYDVEQMSQKLISMDKLKDRFLANVSRELQAPLNGMVGIAESMLAKDTGGLNRQQKDNLLLIVSSGRRLGILVSDLLDLTRIKNNDITLNIKPVDIKQFVQMVVVMMKPLADSKHLALYNHVPDDIPRVEADEDRLLQIFHNLIGNAVKFTSSGNVTVSASTGEGMVEITVADTGCGIPADRHDKIFSYHERGEQKSSGMTDGPGLGLSITKTLVEMHKGQIWLLSEPQNGSRFIFTLPVVSTQSSRVEEDKNDIEPGIDRLLDRQCPAELTPREETTGLRIMVVDNEPVNLQVVASQLVLEEYEVFTASCGNKALTMLDEKPEFDLIILDVMLPDLSGLEVCRLVREKYSLLELPVLMLTARNRTSDILLAFEVGANDYLCKPFDRCEMLARVKNLLTVKKVMKQVVATELKFMQAQIKPHFIYNTLNIIMAFCRTDPNKAADLLDELGYYLRGKFSSINLEQLIPLEKELDLVKSYLVIEQARFDDRLKVAYNLAPDVSVDIPPLVLQPLVENAVKHGICPKMEGGRLEIAVRKEKQAILIQVFDDGVGMTRDKVNRILTGQDNQAGIGIQNVHKRLTGYFGCGLVIQSAVGKGTTITIKIPQQQGGKNYDYSDAC